MRGGTTSRAVPPWHRPSPSLGGPRARLGLGRESETAAPTLSQTRPRQDANPVRLDPQRGIGDPGLHVSAGERALRPAYIGENKFFRRRPRAQSRAPSSRRRKCRAGLLPSLVLYRCRPPQHQRLCSVPAYTLFRAEQAKIDRLAHLEVADRRGMNPIATIIGRLDEVRIIGAAHDLVEVDHRIKVGPLADPPRGLSGAVKLKHGRHLRLAPRTQQAHPRAQTIANLISCLRMYVSSNTAAAPNVPLFSAPPRRQSCPMRSTHAAS
jgi:hypothetical protein